MHAASTEGHTPAHYGSSGTHHSRREMDDFSARSTSDWRHSSESVEFLWAPPHLRKGTHAEDVHEHWLELFIDLILVAFLSNLSHVLLTSGPSMLNYWVKFHVYYLVLSAMHFISYVVNLLVIHDAATIFFLFIVTTGIYLMANAIHTKVHWPCKAHVGTDSVFIQSFYAGAILSTVGEICMYLQIGVFLKQFRGFAKINLAANTIILLYSVVGAVTLSYGSANLTFSVYNSWFIYLHIVNFTRLGTMIVTAVKTSRITEMNMSHFYGRLGMLMVVNLGEWLIQILTSTHDKWGTHYCILQLFLCFGLALQIFNTRPHEIHKTSSSFLTPVNFILLVHLHYALGYFLFLAGTAIDLEEEVEGLYDKSGALHAHHRRLSGGHGGHGKCTEETGWSIFSSMEFRSNSLGCVMILVLIIRHFNKNIVMGRGAEGDVFEYGIVLPGWKMMLRLCLASMHFSVPFVFDLIANVEDAREKSMMMCTVTHFVIILASVVSDISVHDGLMVCCRWLRGRSTSARHLTDEHELTTPSH